MTKAPTSRATRTPSQVIAQQKADADADRIARIQGQKLASHHRDENERLASEREGEHEFRQRERAAKTAAAAKSQDGLAAVLDAAKETAIATAATIAVALPDGRTPREVYL